MADDKSKRDYKDRDRINRRVPYEVEYWSSKFGVSREQLLAATQRVGPMVEDVRRELQKLL